MKGNLRAERWDILKGNLRVANLELLDGFFEGVCEGKFVFGIPVGEFDGVILGCFKGASEGKFVLGFSLG